MRNYQCIWCGKRVRGTAAEVGVAEKFDPCVSVMYHHVYAKVD